jgi:hypothetical protein
MRPDEIGTWLKNGRKYHAMPPIASADNFEDAWLKWWVHLQPECRGEWPELSREISQFSVWQELQKGGPNGFFLILLSYCWWGAYRLSHDGNPIEPGHSKWTNLFADIEWVLDQMIADLEHSHKQVQEDADNLNGEAKPRSKWVREDTDNLNGEAKPRSKRVREDTDNLNGEAKPRSKRAREDTDNHNGEAKPHSKRLVSYFACTIYL